MTFDQAKTLYPNRLRGSGRQNAQGGLSRAMSYDRPVITSLEPMNAPPSGFTTPVTIFGTNFGLGPEFPSMQTCPQSRPELQLLFDPPRDEFCSSGFVSKDQRMFVRQFDTEGQEFSVEWYNIRPYSLALDPIACAFNVYKLIPTSQ